MEEPLPTLPETVHDRADAGRGTAAPSRAALLAPLEDVPAPARQRLARSLPPSRSQAEAVPRRSLFTWTGHLAATLAILWSLAFHVSEVRGSSMAPTILDSDRIMVDEVSHRVWPVEAGAVVVHRYPHDPSVRYVKRVIGVAGDEILLEQGRVWRNGALVEEAYLAGFGVDPHARVHTVVQPGHLFVLGDNRPRSSDSRDFGQVPIELIVGTVRATLWPLEHACWTL